MRREATYEDLLEVPEHMVAEIIDGELYASPRPASPHAVAASGIAADLHGRFHGPPGGADRPGGWWILFEPELHLGKDVIVPDLAGWRRERLPRKRRGLHPEPRLDLRGGLATHGNPRPREDDADLRA